MFQLVRILVQGTAGSAKAKRVCPGCGVQLPVGKKDAAKDNLLCKHCVKVRRPLLIVSSVCFIHILIICLCSSGVNHLVISEILRSFHPNVILVNVLPAIQIEAVLWRLQASLASQRQKQLRE